MTDPTSAEEAEKVLEEIYKFGNLNSKSVILVGNKTDLVRTREVHIDGRY